MAAMRSALVMLGRRSCGSSGSLPASPMVGGRGPSLRPSTHSLEGLRRFSAGGPQNVESGLRMWWQRSKDRIRNVNHADRVRFHLGCSTILLSSAMVYLVKSLYFPGRKRTASLRRA